LCVAIGRRPSYSASFAPPQGGPNDSVAFAATANVEIRADVHTADSASVTVAEAGRLWIETAERGTPGREPLERSTVEAYRQHLRLHVEPCLGNVKLSQLSTPTIREFEDRLRRGDMPDGAKAQPRSPAMVRKVRVSLSSLLSGAQERGLVSRNVVRDLRRGRQRGAERRAEKHQKGKLKVGVDIPTREEIKTIVEAAKGRRRPFILTAIFSGLRASELRGLRWDNVELDRRELHVRQRADRFNEFGRPKSESGERAVPLTPIVVNTLREWKLACPKGDKRLVFPTGSGNVESHFDIVKRGLSPTLVAAGVAYQATDSAGKPPMDEDDAPIMLPKYTGLHALRHFHASWCINRRGDGALELPPKVVQERLGHSSIVMTMDVYGHLFPRGDDSAELEAAERSLLG
jgi:integrase